MDERALYLNGRLIVTQGDITRFQVDAIVNAANSSLMGGGGVDGMIHLHGGPPILEECREIRRHSYPEGLPVGEAVSTAAGNLPAQYVIHTVGPVWHGGTGAEAEQLAAAYRNSLHVAAGLAVKSVAFPAISTGIFRFPRDKAARIAYHTIQSFFITNTAPYQVYCVLYSQDDWEVFIAQLPEQDPG